jgi:hypothetical protein
MPLSNKTTYGKTIRISDKNMMGLMKVIKNCGSCRFVNDAITHLLNEHRGKDAHTKEVKALQSAP